MSDDPVSVHRKRPSRAAELTSTLETLLDLLGAGAVFLSDRRRILFATGVAQRALDAGDGLVKLPGGHLDAEDPRDSGALARGIRHAFSSRGVSPPVPLHRSKRGSPFHVVPVSVPWDGHRAVALLLVDYAADSSARDSQLAMAHGLTAAERRVTASLIAGQRVGEIARHLGVQENTVRAHLKSVFQKTGVRSQSALVAYLLRGHSHSTRK